MIKSLRWLCVFVLCGFLFAIMIGKNSLRHISYEEYISTYKYFPTPVAEVRKTFIDLDDIFIKRKDVKSLNDLMERTDYVLRIKISDEPIFWGNGIINQTEVLEVLKAADNNINIGDSVKIYDLISTWQGDYVNYYGGMTPLNKKYEYIVFVKKAPRPNMENTYIFSSIEYGRFNISIKESNVLENYQMGSYTVKDIMEYDYVEIDCSTAYGYCEEYADDYTKMKEELLDFLAL